MAISTDQIDAILPFLDEFESEDFCVGAWSDSGVALHCLEYDERVTRFQKALYDNGWVAPSFNWPDWQESARQFVDNLAQVDSTDAATIQKLLTTHVRKERFCEGHLAAMLENGHIIALLRRLKQIRQGRG